MTLTVERLRELLHYEPKTGVFTRLVTRGRMVAGSRAGTKEGDYVLIGVDCEDYRAHRLAWFYMTGEWPKNEIDHKNTIRSDNTWTNLREATRSQNQANSPRYSTNTSGAKGVSIDKRTGRWKARIKKDGKDLHLGFHSTFEAALVARRTAANNLFGEFARVE